MRGSLLVCWLLIAGCCSAQGLAYDAPLTGPLLVTGTFGELRSNHFHAGLDFRASVGTPVRSVADGFISRIYVGAGGYGQAIYIDHPDGHRSVYAHLEALAPELRDTVRATQYGQEQFAVNLDFDSLAFPVSRGQLIGEVGNRGHSFGAHLHFEMRDIAGDAPVNPLAFGFPVADHRAPDLRDVRIYELDGQRLEVGATTLPVSKLPDTVFVSTPRIAVGLKAYDRQDGLPNNNGIYAARLLTDTTLLFRFAFDRIPFERTEYLNALTDYRDWHANQSWFHLLWARTQDAEFLDSSPSAATRSGSITLRPGQPLDLRVEVEDFAGNRSVTTLTVVHQPPPGTQRTGKQRPHQYFLPAGEASLIDNGQCRLELSPTNLYESLYFRYARLPDGSADRLSATHQLHDRLTPLHGRATLSIRADRSLPDSLRKRTFIGYCTDEGKIVSNGGSWTDADWMTTRIRGFGDYAIFLDTLPPTIAIRSFPTDMRGRSEFSLLIEDETAGGSLQYRATVDGKWILLELDAKSGRLTHVFEAGRIAPGTHQFDLSVTDARGNTASFRRKFRR